MTTESTEAKAEATPEAVTVEDGSQLARARDGSRLAEDAKALPLPLQAITQRVRDWWEALRAEIARAVTESKYGDLRDRYAERIADSDASLVRWGLTTYLWVVAVPSKVALTFLDQVTDWPERVIAAVACFEVFSWLLTGSLWFPW